LGKPAQEKLVTTGVTFNGKHGKGKGPAKKYKHKDSKASARTASSNLYLTRGGANPRRSSCGIKATGGTRLA
jgi:hypothetical protein